MKQNLFKRIGFVLMLVLTLGLYANAQEPDAVWYYNGSKHESPSGFWTTNASSGYNPKTEIWSYAGITSKQAVKFGSGVTLSFDALARFDLVIVQAYRSGYMSGDNRGFELTYPDGTVKVVKDLCEVETATNKCEIFKITGLEAGKYIIGRTNNKEVNLGYVSITYTAVPSTRLDTPTLSYAEGKVTISDVDPNADHIEYTINGGAAQTYTGPFDINDGDVVKAWAVATAEGYVDSKSVEKQFLVEGITVATPVIKQQNGTVGIYCSTANATVEYSLDNVTWTAYARPFTLSENATVYARASRANCTGSEVATLDVNSVIPPVEGATFKLMANGSFTHVDDSFTAEGYTVAVGKAGDNVEGYKLILMNTGKKSITGGNKVLIPELNATRTTIKTSGAPCTYQVVVPDGYRADRVTLYSYVNYATGEPTYWSEVNGVEYTDEIPFGAINGTANFEKEVPDARVFDLRNAKGKGAKEFTFTCSGLQTCFVVGMDVVEDIPMDVYFAGNDNKWNPKDENYKFTTTDGVTYTLTLPNGISSDWKICNGTWDWSFGKGASISLNEECDVWFNSSSNFDLKTSGETTITFTLVEGSDVQNSQIASRIKVEGQPFVEPTVHSIYFAGTQTNWGDNKLEFTKNDNDVYTLTLEDGITGEWKIVCDNNWFGLNGDSKLVPFERYCLVKDNGNNIDLTTSGKTTIEIEVVEGVPYATVKTSGFDAIYFDNTDSQWTAPHAYIWKSAATETKGDPFKVWPGIAMSKVPAPAVVTYAVEKDVYEVAVPMYKGYDQVIFSDNGANKTDDLVLVLEHVYKADGSHEVYNGTTGVDEIAVDDANVAPVYYNLQGARVQNPANGAYIMVRGSKVTKVIR